MKPSLLWNRICLLFTAGVLVSVLIFLGCRDEGVTHELLTIQGKTMGTSFVVKVVQSAGKQNVTITETLETEINSLLREVNRQMSTYQKDSEISQFNQYGKTDWFPVSPAFATVLESAVQIADISDGAFDFTVGNLVNLWGFGPDARPEKIPTDAQIAERKAVVGYEQVSVRHEAPVAVRKVRPAIHCDLSAIAKGFGVDKVAEYLESLGLVNYLVEIGGEVRALGQNQLGSAWRIGVETPDSPNGIHKVVALSGYALATSGDYFNYFEKDGQRYSHTIDPRTGRPITHKLASVTVLHSSCMMADGLATAINVLGPDKGLEFARGKGLAVFMLIRSNGGFSEKMTPEFATLFSHEKKKS